MRVARTLADLRSAVADLRTDGATIGLVPTMGALHPGHLSLIDHAAGLTKHVVCSLFVNPTQFAPGEDLDAYPRTEADDLTAMEARGAALAWVPTPCVMYPEGFQTEVQVTQVSRGLCGDSRPHHFGGVATVVLKLFNQVQPDVAVFGEKDFQQLKVLQTLARDLDLTVTVVGAPIVRDGDGLALSSRNAYLTPDERSRAPQLYQTLLACGAALRDGKPVTGALEEARSQLSAAGFAVEYLEVSNADTLLPAEQDDRGVLTGAPGTARLLAASTLGRTRLIDNIAV